MTPLAPTIDMVVRLRRPHACGADTFRVVAVGADIRLLCARCGAKIFLERPRFASRVVEVVEPGTGGAE
jgi:hypothetical protein